VPGAASSLVSGQRVAVPGDPGVVVTILTIMRARYGRSRRRRKAFSPGFTGPRRAAGGSFIMQLRAVIGTAILK
jgi:hypothetical protein